MNGQTALSRDAERRLHREEETQAAALRRKRWQDAIARARAQGFTERQAPFAASAYLTLRFLRVAQPTVEEVRARVKAQWPFLYTSDSEEATP